MEVLATKLRYPPDDEPLDVVGSSTSPVLCLIAAQDEVESFNAYRRDFGETFVYIATFLKVRDAQHNGTDSCRAGRGGRHAAAAAGAGSAKRGRVAEH